MTDQGIEVAVTGTAWMGSGVGSIESALISLFERARGEITLTAYAIGEGADLLFEMIEGALARGIRIRFVINRFSTQPPEVNRKLYRLAETYPHMRLFDFTPDGNEDLHAKAIVADRRAAIVGSSNLSRRGLIRNHELALVVEGVAAEEVARALDLLCSWKGTVEVTP